MHPKAFFPDLFFGWSYVAVLLALLTIAALVDFRTARIPKIITLGVASTGLLANIIRGAWLGAQGRETWQLGAGSAWLGAADGFLFAVAGLLFAFIVYFGMFALNCCGGGDVKLCAAIGTWIGAYYTVFLLFATVGALVIWMAGKIVVGGGPSLAKGLKVQRKLKGKLELPRYRMTFSFPAAVSTAVVMLWFCRYDLELTPQPPASQQEAQHASALTTTFGAVGQTFLSA